MGVGPTWLHACSGQRRTYGRWNVGKLL